MQLELLPIMQPSEQDYKIGKLKYIRQNRYKLKASGVTLV